MSQTGGNGHVVLKKSEFVQKSYPELISILKHYIMKTLKIEKTQDIFIEFALSLEEMINVRGGEEDMIIKPPVPPIKI